MRESIASGCALQEILKEVYQREETDIGQTLRLTERKSVSEEMSEGKINPFYFPYS